MKPTAYLLHHRLTDLLGRLDTLHNRNEIAKPERELITDILKLLDGDVGQSEAVRAAIGDLAELRLSLRTISQVIAPTNQDADRRSCLPRPGHRQWEQVDIALAMIHHTIDALTPITETIAEWERAYTTLTMTAVAQTQPGANDARTPEAAADAIVRLVRAGRILARHTNDDAYRRLEERIGAVQDAVRDGRPRDAAELLAEAASVTKTLHYPSDAKATAPQSAESGKNICVTETRGGDGLTCRQEAEQRANGCTAIQVAKERAEAEVKRNGGKWPGVNQLCELIRCGKPTLYRAIKLSSSLAARKAQYEDERRNKPRTVPLNDVILDDEAERQAQIDDLVNESNAEEHQQERLHKRVRMNRSRYR